MDERPSSDVPSKVVQTFTVQYRKPFIGSDLNDVDLWPEQEFNITSAYGCYLKSDETTEGFDGSVLKALDYESVPATTSSAAVQGSFIGCKSHWQSINGQVIFSEYTAPAAGTTALGVLGALSSTGAMVGSGFRAYAVEDAVEA